MSSPIFTGTRAPARTSKETQEWCQTNLPAFWKEQIWPGNSTDLNQLETLWGIFQPELDKSEPCTSVRQRPESLHSAWANIPRDLLESLVASMPSRVLKCRTLCGEHINI